MADLCQQCSIEIWGEDSRDLADSSRIAGRLAGQSDTIYQALCEGCGLTWVDNAGRCVDRNCRLHGDSQKPSAALLSSLLPSPSSPGAV